MFTVIILSILFVVLFVFWCMLKSASREDDKMMGLNGNGKESEK